MSVKNFLDGTPLTKNWADISVHQIEAKTAIIETLEVTGDIILDGGLEVKGDTVLDQKLNVAGLSTLSGGAKFLSSGGTASTLNHYEVDTTSLNGNWVGASSGSVASVGTIVMLGSIVTISFENCTGSISGTVSYSVPVPSRFRPASAKYFSCVVADNGGAETSAGLIVFRADGTVNLYPAAATSGFTVSMLLHSSTFTYQNI